MKRAELRLRRRRGERIEPTRQTFGQYAAEWLDQTNGRKRSREVHSWALRQHLIPYFGLRRLDQITVDDIAAFITHMRSKRCNTSDRLLRGWTTTTALRPLSLILAQAARRGHIGHNPMILLERGERPKHDDQRPKRILTLEEMQAVIAGADADIYRCLIELLLTSGVRIGEALGLVVGDLDRTHSLIRVEYQLDRNGIRTPLKTEESRRVIDIPDELIQCLFALFAERGALFDPHALVFANRMGGGLERKVARNALKRAVENAGIAAPAPCLHDLRHSHASMLIGLGTPVTDVQRRLGHRKPDTTLRIYAHQWKERDARRSQIGQQLGRLFTSGNHAALPVKHTMVPLAFPTPTARDTSG